MLILIPYKHLTAVQHHLPMWMNKKTIGNSSWQKFSSFLSEILHGLQTGFDFQLLRNLHFLFFCFNICLFTSSHWTIPVFLPALSLEKGIKVMESALLISIIGISDLISRIVMGLFLDLKWVKPYRRCVSTWFQFVASLISRV